MAKTIKIRRGFVEWDLAAESAEEALWEVGVRAALVRPGVVTERIAPVVRGEDINTAYVPNRSKFNVYVHREEVQILTLNPSDVITRDQVRVALNAGKYLELRLKPLLKDVELLLKWLEVLEPEITLFSTPVESPRDAKSPIDVAGLLVELTDDESWSRPFVKGVEILVELISSHE